jgi:hypothetical protein
MANIAYANLHDGSYVPVRKPPPNVGNWWWSGNNQLYPRWFENPEFQELIGEALYIADEDLQNESNRMNMGWNNTDLFTGNLLGGSAKFAFNIYDIPEPGRLIAFAESNDWMVDFAQMGKWTPAVDEGDYDDWRALPAPAFRTSDELIVVTFDGAVSRLSYEEANEFDRWSLRAPRYR